MRKAKLSFTSTWPNHVKKKHSVSDLKRSTVIHIYGHLYFWLIRSFTDPAYTCSIFVVRFIAYCLLSVFLTGNWIFNDFENGNVGNFTNWETHCVVVCTKNHHKSTENATDLKKYFLGLKTLRKFLETEPWGEKWTAPELQDRNLGATGTHRFTPGLNVNIFFRDSSGERLWESRLHRKKSKDPIPRPRPRRPPPPPIPSPRSSGPWQLHYRNCPPQVVAAGI